MYTFKCEHCGAKLDILRKYDEQTPPTPDEWAPPCASKAAQESHDWVKVIHAPRMMRGANWSGSKGNW